MNLIESSYVGSILIKSKCSCVCVWNSWGHNVENVKMTGSSLHQEWVSILSKCVFVKFNQIDFFASQDIAKKQTFFGKISRPIRREG